MFRRRAPLLALLLSCAACGSELGDGESFVSEPRTNWERDILSTGLTVDLESRRATAVIEVDKSARVGASLEVGGLTIESVESPDGPLPYEVVGDRLDIGIKARQPATLIVDYRFEFHSKLQGALHSGATFLWPYYCGNLFPCKSTPADGLTFSLQLTGVADDQVAIYPQQIIGNAPSYQLAWSMGDYTSVELGVTDAGRRVSVHYLPGEQTAATKGTKNLVAIFEWLERTYGEYTFGDEVASVSASWGPGAFGGMEHHPYWHVSRDSMADEETHAHEAAHGWFGAGVRIRCWEDLTLSEGTTTYLAARAIEAIAGVEAGDEVWGDYEQTLDHVIANDDRAAWPQTCDEIDVLTDLWNNVPYMKGAFFYRAVEEVIGREAIDGVLSTFYARYKGQAAGMRDMLDTIESETGFDPQELADGWLLSMGRPDVP